MSLRASDWAASTEVLVAEVVVVVSAAVSENPFKRAHEGKNTQKSDRHSIPM